MMTDRTPVTWTITDTLGNSLAGRAVYVQLVHGGGGATVDGETIADLAHARADATGIVVFDLYPTGAMEPEGCYYGFTVDQTRPTLVRYHEIPESEAPVDLANLDQVHPATPPPLVPSPADGDDGQLLGIVTLGDRKRWGIVDPPTGDGSGLPDGGSTGQVLTKESDADGDADWADPAGGGGGTAVRLAEYPSVGLVAIAVGTTDGTAETFHLLEYAKGSPGSGIIPADWVSTSGEQPIVYLDYILLGAFGEPFDPANPDTFAVPGHGGVFKVTASDAPFVPVAVADGVTPVLSKGDSFILSAGKFIATSPALPTFDDRIFAAEQYTQEEYERAGLVLAQERPTADDPSSFDGNAWFATNLSLIDLPAGIDVRAGIFLKAPIAIPPEGFGQILTREDPAMDGGDNVEMATANAGTVPIPRLFGESARVGATSEDGTDAEAGLRYGQYAEVRWTAETASQTMALWRRVPMGGEVVTDDGISWKLLGKITGEKWASIANVDYPWCIGNGLFGSVHWLTAHHYGGDRFIGLTRDAIATAGEGATTVVCEEGVEFVCSGASRVGRFGSPLVSAAASASAAVAAATDLTETQAALTAFFDSFTP